MRYNDKSGHWELWHEFKQRWVDLYTCDSRTATRIVEKIISDPQEYPG